MDTIWSLLSKQLGVEDIGSHPYVPPPQADINGPIDPALVHAYLARTGQVYPSLFQYLNPGSMEAFLQQAPESPNIEDRRQEHSGRIPRGPRTEKQEKKEKKD